MRQTTLVLLFSLMNFAVFGQGLGMDLRDVYSKSKSQSQLSSASNLDDLIPGFPSSFITSEDYVKVEIKTTCNSQETIAFSNGYLLTEKQKEILNCADLWSNLKLIVQYNSKNVVTKEIEIRTLDYSVRISPQKQADYVGGYEALRNYMRTEVLEKFEDDSSKLSQGSVNFSISADGVVRDAKTTKTTGLIYLDLLILKAIQAMPDWQPALDSDGRGVEQEFELVVGDMLGC